MTVTRFQPQGLGLYNQAFAGSTTTLRITILRGGGQPVATPRYRLRTVRVQASTNNGLTWQALTLSLNGSFWLAHVHNPAIGGYVWLRSTITDSHGDSTMETISRAYLVLGV